MYIHGDVHAWDNKLAYVYYQIYKKLEGDKGRAHYPRLKERRWKPTPA